MTLDDFIKNNYQKYLSKSQREYLLEHKKFRDKKAVQKQLSRYFERVSIKMRGRTLVIAMGQPRIKVEGDKLKDALTKKIALRYDPNKLQSFSWWVWQLNIDINHEKISFEDTKEKKIYAITKELVENKQMAWFQSAFNAFSKRVGDGYSLIMYGLAEEETKTGTKKVKRPLLSSEIYKIEKLKELLEDKGIKDPREQRESELWQELITSMGYINVYNVYKVKNLNENELDMLRGSRKKQSFEDAKKLFYDKIDKWMREKIKERYKGIEEFLELELVNPLDYKTPTLKQWKKFKEFIFVERKDETIKTNSKED